MRTLPRDTRITIRTIDRTIAALVKLAEPRWQGDRVSVVITDRADVQTREELPKQDPRGQTRNLSGAGNNRQRPIVGHRVKLDCIQPAIVVGGQEQTRYEGAFDVLGYMIDLPPGLGFMVLNDSARARAESRGQDVTLFLSAFTSDPERQGALDAARDAILEASIGDNVLEVANKLARQASIGDNVLEVANKLARQTLPVGGLHAWYLALCRLEKQRLADTRHAYS